MRRHRLIEKTVRGAIRERWDVRPNLARSTVPHHGGGPIPADNLSQPGEGTGSAVMRAEVFRAREVQAKRFGLGASRLNRRMTPKEVRAHCKLDASSQTTLKEAMEGLGLSARAHDRILRVARTVADLT